MFLLGAVIVAAAPPQYDVAVELTPTHKANPLFMGCHSDTGYAHQSRGIYSQMIMDESFEAEQADKPATTGTGEPPVERWTKLLPANGGSVSLDKTRAMNGLGSMRVEVSVVGDTAGVANRGQGMHGLHLVKNSQYEGYFFASNTAPATVIVSFHDWTKGTTLGATKIALPGNGNGEVDGNFTKIDFNLSTDDAGAGCTDVISCSGEFRVMVSGPGAVSFDFVFLQPGTWGRFKGLSVLKSGADLLATMGVTAVRQGGSFAGASPWYDWTRWTGPVWSRPSVGARWGGDLIAGWGPFDFADFADAAGITLVMTTTATTTAGSFADLVEYCHANTSFPMGRKRAVTDGHPEPYGIKYFELGNEGSNGGRLRNGNYVAQVAAMEKRAAEIGIPGQIKYLFPPGGPTYDEFLSPDDLAAAKKLGPAIDAQMVDSIHTGHHPYYWGGGAAGLARHLFSDPALRGFNVGAANTETNAKQNGMNRAIMEAGDLNDWLNVVDVDTRLHMRCASFCMAQGDGSDVNGFQQGIASFLPNATYLQPPGWVHQMVASTWQPKMVTTTVTGPEVQPKDSWESRWNDTVSGSASVSENGKTAVVRLVNNETKPVAISIKFNKGGRPLEKSGLAVGAVIGIVLSAPLLPSWYFANNSPGAPDNVRPMDLDVKSDGSETTVTLPAHSFAALQYELQ